MFYVKSWEDKDIVVRSTESETFEVRIPNRVARNWLNSPELVEYVEKRGFKWGQDIETAPDWEKELIKGLEVLLPEVEVLPGVMHTTK